MPDNPTDLAAVLNRAAEVIEKNGLHKGAFVAPACVPDRSGRLHVDDLAARPVDMVGAIRIACGVSPEALDCLPANAAVRFASERSEALNGEAPLESAEPDYVEHLAGWSDRPERTTAEVVARLRLLAIHAEIAAERAARVSVRDLAGELGVTIAAVWRVAARMRRAAADPASVVPVLRFRNGDCILSGPAADSVRAELTAKAVA